MRVNPITATPAFTPTVHVRADGVIGVTYYDFRNNTADPATLPTDYWIATSTDALTFRESHLSGPFDLKRAPDAGGLFLGDYQALTSTGNNFLPFFVQTGSGDVGNRTDVFMGFSTIPPVAQAEQAMTAEIAAPARITLEWRQRVQDRILRRLEQRVPDRTRH